MAKARLLAKVGVKGEKGELVYYKDGNLYAVKAKRGGTKGAKRKCSTAKKKTAKRKPAAKKKATATRKPATKKKAVAKKSVPKKRTARKVVKKK